MAKIDELVISHRVLFAVIRLRVGIQYLGAVANHLDSGACPGADPGFAGVAPFYELFKNKGLHNCLNA
jgi:hypothetical protein